MRKEIDVGRVIHIAADFSKIDLSEVKDFELKLTVAQARSLLDKVFKTVELHIMFNDEEEEK